MSSSIISKLISNCLTPSHLLQFCYSFLVIYFFVKTHSVLFSIFPVEKKPLPLMLKNSALSFSALKMPKVSSNSHVKEFKDPTKSPQNTFSKLSRYIKLRQKVRNYDKLLRRGSNQRKGTLSIAYWNWLIFKTHWVSSNLQWIVPVVALVVKQ